MGMLARSIVGSPDTVRAGLAALVAETGADELMVVSDIYDHGARLHSFELIAAAHAGNGKASMVGAVA
jgi:alkanesulfonate monooxygenase SsuD/methylene tetrahydromethanopterin reductase-like flavin-dependent oxidoreductase (luciferase family)